MTWESGVSDLSSLPETKILPWRYSVSLSEAGLLSNESFMSVMVLVLIVSLISLPIDLVLDCKLQSIARPKFGLTLLINFGFLLVFVTLVTEEYFGSPRLGDTVAVVLNSKIFLAPFLGFLGEILNSLLSEIMLFWCGWLTVEFRDAAFRDPIFWHMNCWTYRFRITNIINWLW